jgi:hypothetical protein
MKALELLLAQVTSAHRTMGPEGRLRSHPAWHDLPPEARPRAFELTVELRRLEAAADPRGLTTTAKAVLARIRRGGRT